MSTSLETTAEIEQFLADHDHFIIDCDGVLWKAGQVLPHVIETIRLLQERGKQVIYVTNNSTKSRQEILPKFEQFGFPSHISTQDLIPSSFAAAKYIEQEHQIQKALVIGHQGLVNELAQVGIEVVTEIPEIESEQAFTHVCVDGSIDAVVLGMDFHFSYAKLAYASLVLEKNTRCVFVATSRDEFDQLTDRRLPGMTASVSGIEAASGQVATVVGKPSLWLARYVVTSYDLDPKRTCMIGDRLDSDMVFGFHGNMTKVLVLTGCTSREMVQDLKPEAPCYPAYVLSSLGHLFSATRGSQ